MELVAARQDVWFVSKYQYILIYMLSDLVCAPLSWWRSAFSALANTRPMAAGNQPHTRFCRGLSYSRDLFLE